MADVNGHVLRRGERSGDQTLCLESRGREIVATIVNGAVERAMFGDKADTATGTAAWPSPSRLPSDEPLVERD